MYLCYIDETGTRDPRLRIPQKDGTEKDGDRLYVLTGLCIFERNWHTMEKRINRHKMALVERIKRDNGLTLQLADCEVKSNWIRHPKERANHVFLSHLTNEELLGLADVFYQQLEFAHASVFSVIVDKKQLPAGTTQYDVHLRSWERLLELIEQFMRACHHKHQAIMINDDVSREMNRMLAMGHAQLLDEGTNRDTWLRHICEMPMFVRSELSAGVQLADLCSYNIYRAFKTGDLAYPFFQRIAPYIWSVHDHVFPGQRRFSGIQLLDGTGSSDISSLLRKFENEQALAKWGQGLK